MERLDVASANRYLAALNRHFHPDRFPKPTYSWQVIFDAANRPDPIIVQHMLAGGRPDSSQTNVRLLHPYWWPKCEVL
jgi:Family of unknown function (DUF5995)